jgi:hypothetical protein
MKSPESMVGRAEICKKCGYMNSVPESKWRRFFRFDEETRLTLKVAIGVVAIAAVVTSICLAIANMKGSDRALREKHDALQSEYAAIKTEDAQLRDDKEKLAAQLDSHAARIAALEGEQSRLQAQLRERKAGLAQAPGVPVKPEAPSVEARAVAPPGPPAGDSASRTARKERPKTEQETIAEAVARGVVYLKSIQNEDGSFTGQYRASYPFGETALALLAMRYAGTGLSDPAYEKGSKLLLEGTSDKTYVNSLIAQVLAMIPANRRSFAGRKRMTQLAQFLTSTQCETGMWSYGPLAKSANGRPVLINPLGGDNSNTQFAVLGLWKLAEAGVEFDRRTLRTCESHFLETQHLDGGWGYNDRAPRATAGNRRLSQAPSGPAMTAAGLATLDIFTDLLHLNDEGVFAAGYAPNCGRSGPLDQQIDAAMVKAEADLEAFLNPPGPARGARRMDMNTEYYLYSVERVGAASGKKHFGDNDWYASVARLFLATQNADGSWGPPHNTVETALAILFLAKGRAPIFFEKLRYDGDWCNDRRDVAHVTAYAGRELEQHFNWEIIDIKSDVSGWFDGPVLFFNGHDGPKLNDEEKKRIKDYVARGGFLFAEACCGRPKFAAAARQLGQELWPDLEWKILPADHPLYTRQSHVDLKKAPPLEGLTDAQGFTFFILSPQDVSCIWNQNLMTDHENEFLLALNVYAYARHGQPIRARSGQ